MKFNIFAALNFQKMTKRQQIGHLAMLAASVMWGLMAPVSKHVMSGGLVVPLVVTDVRIYGAAVLFWIASIFTKKEKIERKDYLRLFFAGMFAIIFNQGVFITGVSMTSPVDASVITTSLPIVAMLISAVYLKEPITGKKAGGVALGAAGALLLVFGNRLLPGLSHTVTETAGRSSDLTGDLLCFAAQCSYAVYLVIFKDLICKYSPVTLMKWMFTFASMVMIPFTIDDFVSTSWNSVPLDQYLSLAFVMLGGTFFCYLLVPIGQKALRPTLVAMYNYVQPVVSTFAAILWGMDSFNILKLLSVILIFSGVFLVNKSKARNPEDNG